MFKTLVRNVLAGFLFLSGLNLAVAQTYKCVEDPVQDETNKVTIYVVERHGPDPDVIAKIYHKNLITGRSWFETYVENCTTFDHRYLLRCTKDTRRPDGTTFHREFHIFNEFRLPAVYEGAYHHELNCAETFWSDAE
ncbi:MAG: hypothetical protein AB8G05_04910 [Oligoflexales bacterium]